jgi:hypothetical protein
MRSPASGNGDVDAARRSPRNPPSAAIPWSSLDHGPRSYRIPGDQPAIVTPGRSSETALLGMRGVSILDLG